MPIYMKYASIEGDVTTAGFEKWIEVNSAQLGVGRGMGSPVGGDANREASAPSISEITVTKPMDISSAQLMQESTGGVLDNKVTLKFATQTKNKLETYLTYDLENVGLSGYSVSSGGDKPSESLSLNFTKITMTWSGLDPATKAKPKSAFYDLTKTTTG